MSDWASSLVDEVLFKPELGSKLQTVHLMFMYIMQFYKIE